VKKSEVGSVLQLKRREFCYIYLLMLFAVAVTGTAGQRERRHHENP